jgi:hypothetical protein
VFRGLATWTAARLVARVVGRLAARRLDRGDESATDIRRVLIMDGEELRPTNPALTRVRLDLAMAGASST